MLSRKHFPYVVQVELWTLASKQRTVIYKQQQQQVILVDIQYSCLQQLHVDLKENRNLNHRDLFNPFKTEAVIIYKPVQ